MRKVIEFQKPKGKGPAQVETRWETVAAPPCGPELWRIMEATAEADWPQDVRVVLGEKVAEIQGDRGLVQAREAADTLLGGATPEWVANPGDAPPEGEGCLAGRSQGDPTASEGAAAEVAGEAGQFPVER